MLINRKSPKTAFSRLNYTFWALNCQNNSEFVLPAFAAPLHAVSNYAPAKKGFLRDNVP